MKLRQKFGLVAWIYVLSLTVNLVMSCLTIIVYFESTFQSFDSNITQQSLINSAQRLAQEQIQELEQHLEDNAYDIDSRDTIDELKQRLLQISEPTADTVDSQLWTAVQQTIAKCNDVSSRRMAQEDTNDSTTAASSDNLTPHDLLALEVDHMKLLNAQLTAVSSSLEDQRSSTVDATSQRNTMVLTILTANATIGALLCVLGIMLFRKWVMQPVEQLRGATREISAGTFTHRIHNNSSDELGDLGREVNRMAETISAMQTKMVEQERLAAAGEMVTRLAHNIRNPLGGIRGLAEATLSAHPDERDTAECQQRIIDTVDRFEKWLRDLQQSVSPLELRLQEVAVEDMALDIVTALRPMLERRRVDIDIEVDPKMKMVKIDALHFEQAIVSLLTNAVQASQADQRVRVTVGPVIESEEQWVISVEDDGSGIPEEIRDKIFEPYFTTKPDGNGIGLAMVNKVVKIHGGKLSVESQVGQGSRFTAVLPGRVNGVS